VHSFKNHCLGCAVAASAPRRCGAGRCLRDDAFYKQLLKTPQTNGYTPTRSFVVINDCRSRHNWCGRRRATAFYQLWMQQYQPGYRAA